MDIEEIKALKVNELADKDCVLFLWATSPLLPEALEVIKAWGFKYTTIGFVWSKKYKDGSPVSNMGRWTMGNVELCLLAKKGKPQRICKNVKQLVEDLREGHSRKPDIFRERIVELMGDLPRVELFARETNQPTLTGKKLFDGWDTWGNEVKNDIIL
jgi:site-specific DNA-methyltransferase (adenine-specific)